MWMNFFKGLPEIELAELEHYPPEAASSTNVFKTANVGPMVFRDHGKWTEFTELAIWNGIMMVWAERILFNAHYSI